MSLNAPHRHGKRAGRSLFTIPESSASCSSVHTDKAEQGADDLSPGSLRARTVQVDETPSVAAYTFRQLTPTQLHSNHTK